MARPSEDSQLGARNEQLLRSTGSTGQNNPPLIGPENFELVAVDRFQDRSLILGAWIQLNVVIDLICPVSLLSWPSPETGKISRGISSFLGKVGLVELGNRRRPFSRLLRRR